MVAARLLLSLLPAWLVTFGLFHLMQSLISVEATLPTEGSSTSMLEIVKVMITPKPPKPVTQTIRRVVALAPPPSLENLSPAPSRSLVDEGFSVRGPSSGEDPRQLFEDEASHASLDSEAIPVVRVEPQYPAQAARQGREGRVLVEFTVGRSGSVETARVVAAEPEGVFDREAVEAVKQWKYNPRIEQGRAVPQPGLRTTITFRLGQEGF